MLQKYYCWGRPIGSSLLWQQHFDTIARISQIVDDIELAPVSCPDIYCITVKQIIHYKTTNSSLHYMFNHQVRK